TYVVNGLGPCKANEIGQTFGETLLHLRAQRLIAGVDRTIEYLEPPVAGPGAPLFDRTAVIWSSPVQRVIEITHALQLVSPCSEIAEFENHIFAQLSLYIERPLKNIRRSSERAVRQHERLAEAGSRKACARKKLALKLPGISKEHVRLFQIRP